MRQNQLMPAVMTGYSVNSERIADKSRCVSSSDKSATGITEVGGATPYAGEEAHVSCIGR